MENNNRDEFFDDPSPAPSPAPSSAPSPANGKSNQKATRVVALVLGAVLIAVAAFLGGWFGQYYSLDEEVRTYLWAKSVLEENYYQPVDEAELYQNLYNSLSIDPYTQFFPPEEYDSYIAEGAGENMGIGVSFFAEQKENDVAQIFSVVENSPACRAGLRKGMYILSFGTSASDLTAGTYAQFRTFLSAQKGEFVLRCGFDKSGAGARDYTIKRESYQASFLHYRDSETSFRFQGSGSAPALTETHEPLVGLDAKTAYIRLDEFSGNNTSAEFVQLLNTMKERGRENLILDLRSNGGGYLGILGDIASHLLRNATERNPVVTVTRARSGQITRYVCAQNDFSSYFPATARVYVLADEYSASASECLIGALVDYGTVPFENLFLRENEAGIAKTYGKGIMQAHFESANGAAMKVTTATVNWPLSDKCIHGVGVTPEDGAVPIPAPFLWGESDPMLQEVLSRVCG